jgi:hypothetical protein
MRNLPGAEGCGETLLHFEQLKDVRALRSACAT